ncbi:MAG: SMP-30/gluconolactonase/LRE family protein [Devosia sp.]
MQVNDNSSPKLKILMEGIFLGETPRWRDGKLWFGDWVAEKLYTLDEAGDHAVEANIASLPFSIDWLPDGRLLVVNARENTLQRREADGSFVTHADLSTLSPYGCNEIVVDARGDIYVNNVSFDFPGGEFRPGFIAVVTPAGEVRRVAEGVAFPNGMAITPNGKTLICAESFSKKLTAFDIGADGSLTNQRLWAQMEGWGADGICLDAEGAVWAGSGKACVRIREGGEVLQRIEVDRFCFACMLGGADGKTLFINAAEWTGAVAKLTDAPTGRVYATRVDVPHAGRP